LWLIYKHTNKINDKSYIGITSETLEKRSGPNGGRYTTKDTKGEFSHPKFGPAIVKYGWDNFTHEILEQVETLEEAKLKEQEYIQKFNSKDNGYNATLGGDSIIDPSVRAKAHQTWISKPENFEKARKTITYLRQQEGFVENMLAHNWQTPEQYEAASLRMKKRNSDPEYQKKCKAGVTEEEKNARIKRLKDWRENNPELAKEANKRARETFLKNPDNSRKASERMTAFRKDEDFEAYRLKRTKQVNSKKVICLNTSEIFNSVRQASLQKHISASDISECIHFHKSYAGKDENGNKLKWLLYKDYLNTLRTEGDIID